MAEQRIQSIETDVDRLIRFLKENGRVELKAAARQLGVDEKVLQSWVDFLVEEKILGVDYSLTKPYIYIIGAKKEKEVKGLEDYKKQFKHKSESESKVPEKTAYLWRNHVMEELEKKKQFFYAEAEKKGLQDKDALWEEYKKRVEEIG